MRNQRQCHCQTLLQNASLAAIVNLYLMLFVAISALWPLGAFADQTLLRLDKDSNITQIVTSDATVLLQGDALQVTTGIKANWPGITIKAPQGAWDLTAFELLLLDLKNISEDTVTIYCRVDNPGADGNTKCITERLDLASGQTQTLRVRLRPQMPEDLKTKFFGMRGNPGGLEPERGLDLRNINQLLIFVTKPSIAHVFEVSNLRTSGQRLALLPEENFFPMIDRYGQYRHKDWPGKTHNDTELKRQTEIEAADLETHPGPAEWDQYGGWKTGPALKATGRFRVQKHDGKWWFVDPAGRLFWSLGVDCVGSGSATTPITDREFYFAELPAKDSPGGTFYGQGNWAPHGYYKDKNGYATFNFTAANLWHKYGDEWPMRFAELSHQRLRSWAMNTIGNWSDASIYNLRKTPYTANVSFRSQPLEGSEGYWGKFPDPFDASFEENIRISMNREKGRAVGDPWCLGYFISNELSWGDDLSLALATLASPSHQAAKKIFIEDLKKKYETIARLNATWNTQHNAWDNLLESTTPPEKTKEAVDDLAAFYTHIAEEYFRICRKVVMEVDPKGLYLGCRFSDVNDRAIRAAANYCDVVSFNKYKKSVADFRFPEGVDKPMIIGEFHFGALDRGMFHTGLVEVADQKARAEAYKNYISGALENPWIVGAHWFQFGDQATTGRGDGENYQIGLLDVCDTPYPETIGAVREIGSRMYQKRISQKPKK